jgi:hypothetical protein
MKTCHTGKMKTCLGVATVLALLVACASPQASTMAATEESEWGPLAVLEAPALSEGQRRGRPEAEVGRGTLVISDECVYIGSPPVGSDDGGPSGLTLAWLDIDVSWDPEERAITFKPEESDDPPVRLVDGTEISVGGSDIILDPNHPEFEPKARFNWLAEPHPSCPDDLSWAASVRVRR